jgi:hypothetical protein
VPNNNKYAEKQFQRSSERIKNQFLFVCLFVCLFVAYAVELLGEIGM